MSSPEVEGPIAKEALREAVATVTEQAITGVRAWQRTIEARLERMELFVAELGVQVRATATAQPRAPLPVAAPQSPPLAQAVAVQAPLLVQPPLAPQPAPLAAPAQIYPVVHAVAPPAAGVSATYAVRMPVPSYADEPFDRDMIPGGLDGGRRKRNIAIVALLLLLVGVGGLVALAIASQAVHGL